MAINTGETPPIVPQDPTEEEAKPFNGLERMTKEKLQSQGLSASDSTPKSGLLKSNDTTETTTPAPQPKSNVPIESATSSPTVTQYYQNPYVPNSQTPSIPSNMPDNMISHMDDSPSFKKPTFGTFDTGINNPNDPIIPGGSDPTVPTGPTSPAGTIAEDYNAIRDQLQSNLTDPQLPDSARQEAVLMQEREGEILDPLDPNYQISEQAKIAATGFTAAEAAMAAAVTPAEMAVAQAQYTEVAAAAKGTVSKLASGASASAAQAQAAIQDLNAVDPQTMAKALTHEVPNSATVQGQLDVLLEGLSTGDIPEWAKPAIAQAESAMAERGMSSSSVGQNAMFNSIINAAMPIAQADAKAKLAVFQQDISNEQQAILANSTFFQNLTLKNLDNRQQAAIVNATNTTNANIANAQNATNASIANAQAFLQMDIANLNNAQQAQMMDAQFRQQTMLSNTAAINTALQFNATNQQQADQFNANLATSVNQFNATQQNAASQFNANAENAMAQFNSQQAFQRDQFNVQNATAISQSNAQWRRQMNQVNTASENAVNQANAMNQFNLSNQALTFLWQEQRDAAQWANDNTQNEEERKTRMAIAALSNESMQDSQSLENIKTLAGTAISIFDNWND